MAGRRLALIVATDTYQDPAFRELRSPGLDAARVAEVLSDSGIGQFETTTVLNEPHHSVRSTIEEFADEAAPSDLLLVYMSGHGLKDETGKLYFATTDTKLRTPRSSAVEASFVDETLRHARPRSQVLILDCCFSGAFPVGMASKSDGKVGLADQVGGRGRVVLASSNAIQYSFEGSHLVDAQPGGSVFTSVLVEGLRSGDADIDGDGEVDIDDLYDFLFRRVREIAPSQTPQLSTESFEGRIVIAKNPARDAATMEAAVRALEERRRLRRSELDEALVARSNRLPEVRQAALAALQRISADPETDRDLLAEVVVELTRLGKDVDPAIAVRAQMTLGELSIVRDDADPTTQELAATSGLIEVTGPPMAVGGEDTTVADPDLTDETTVATGDGTAHTWWLSLKQRLQKPSVHPTLRLAGIVAVVMLISLGAYAAVAGWPQPTTTTSLATTTSTSTPTTESTVTQPPPEDLEGTYASIAELFTDVSAKSERVDLAQGEIEETTRYTGNPMALEFDYPMTWRTEASPILNAEGVDIGFQVAVAPNPTEFLHDFIGPGLVIRVIFHLESWVASSEVSAALQSAFEAGCVRSLTGQIEGPTQAGEFVLSTDCTAHPEMVRLQIAVSDSSAEPFGMSIFALLATTTEAQTWASAFGTLVVDPLALQPTTTTTQPISTTTRPRTTTTPPPPTTTTAATTTSATSTTIVNNPPIAQNESFGTLDNDTTYALRVLCNDSDPDGDLLQVVDPQASVGQASVITRTDLCPEKGAVNNAVRWTPPSGYEGPVTITYTVSDSKGGTDAAQASLCVRSPIAQIDPCA